VILEFTPEPFRGGRAGMLRGGRVKSKALEMRMGWWVLLRKVAARDRERGGD